MEQRTTEAQFPEKLRCIFDSADYKVAWGGRGSAKSWSFARALLIKGAQAPLRWLCAREIQQSIKLSVHQLLSDQIKLLGLERFYDILHTEIRGRNGTLFSFTGLATHTVDSIKSFESYDGVWVEEGQTVKKKSWNVLIPTIRKPSSEIWISFNPDLDTDETYTRFIVNTPPDTHVSKINYHDNPWFPGVLEKERQHAKLTMPKEDYENIWEGVCRTSVPGAIYANEISKAHEENRITHVPYDPMLKVHLVFDMGWNDSMFIILAQRHISSMRIIESIEDDHKTLDYYSALLKDKKLNWGKMFLPHDARHKDYKLGKSAEDIMKAWDWDVEIVPDIGMEQGIKVARMGFGQTYFDKTKAGRLVECLKRYKRKINQSNDEPSTPDHDEFSHGADDFRYLHIIADEMTNDTRTKEFLKPIEYDNRGII